MRNLILSLALVSVGCNSNNSNNGPDMSAAKDMALNHDLAGSFICDPVKQDCGAGMKCTYTVDPNNMMSLAQTCVPVTGSAGFEESCDRNAAGDPGQDTCKAGFFCSVIGWGGTTTNPHRHCNQLCAPTPDRPANP